MGKVLPPSHKVVLRTQKCRLTPIDLSGFRCLFFTFMLTCQRKCHRVTCQTLQPAPLKIAGWLCSAKSRLFEARVRALVARHCSIHFQINTGRVALTKAMSHSCEAFHSWKCLTLNNQTFAHTVWHILNYGEFLAAEKANAEAVFLDAWSHKQRTDIAHYSICLSIILTVETACVVLAKQCVDSS